MLSPLSPATAFRDLWQREGWFHVESFLTPAEVAAADEVVNEVWRSRPRNITVDDLDCERRCRMHDLTARHRTHRVKLSDLYLVSAPIRQILLSKNVVRIVEALLGEQPVLCNSLNLERSSAQEYHADSLYMVPRSAGQLVACWFALEDVSPSAGPLRLYPESHLIPQDAVGRRPADWASYVQGELDRRRLQPVSVLARSGDLVVWHSDLVHGAEPIVDRSLTRRSMVAHYFSKSDTLRRGQRIVAADHGYWLKRLAQPVGTGSRLLAAVERRVDRVRSMIRNMSQPFSRR